MSEHERVDVEALAKRLDELTADGGDAAHGETLGSAARVVMAECHRLSVEHAALVAEVDGFHSWSGLMGLLDEHWPDDIFPTLADDTKRDAGARIVSFMRWVDRVTSERDAAIERAERAEAVVAKVRELAIRHGSGHPEYPTISLLDLRAALLPDDEGGR